jgi:hypothetical protein
VVKENNKVNTGHIWQGNFSNKNLAFKRLRCWIIGYKSHYKSITDNEEKKKKKAPEHRLQSKKMPFTSKCKYTACNALPSLKRKIDRKVILMRKRPDFHRNRIRKSWIHSFCKYRFRIENYLVRERKRTRSGRWTPKYWSSSLLKQIHQLPLKKNELITNPVPNTIQKECLWNHKHRFIKR